MSNIPERWDGENQWYFVTVVTHRRKPWLGEAGKVERLLHCFREVRTVRSFWQPRFLDHRIRDEADFARHVFYIRENPGKHEATESPDEWPWPFIHERPFG